MEGEMKQEKGWNPEESRIREILLNHIDDVSQYANDIRRGLSINPKDLEELRKRLRKIDGLIDELKPFAVGDQKPRFEINPLKIPSETES